MAVRPIWPKTINIKSMGLHTAGEIFKVYMTLEERLPFNLGNNAQCELKATTGSHCWKKSPEDIQGDLKMPGGRLSG